AQLGRLRLPKLEATACSANLQAKGWARKRCWRPEPLRSSRSDSGSFAGDSTATQVVLAFEDNRLASLLFGQYGQNLALIERRLGVVAEQRGNHITLAGSRDGVERARRALEGPHKQLNCGHGLDSCELGGAIRLPRGRGFHLHHDPADERPA